MIELKDVHYLIPSHKNVQDDSQNDNNKQTDKASLTIIKGCNLSVQPEEVVAIVGRSGSGKSTLLSLMAGLETPTSGEIHLLGQNISAFSEDQRALLRAQQVGFIFQNFQLMPSMSALENVLMPLELFQIEHAQQKAWQALERVGLADRAHHRPAELSGGEQQRVAIARAFVTEPKILFADEPTGNLDEQTAQQIQQLLFDLNQSQKTTLVVVTHDNSFAKLCQKTYRLTDGHLEQQ